MRSLMPSSEPTPSERVPGGRDARPPGIPRPTQMRTIAVCQKCGRSTTMGIAITDGWLVARYRIDPSLWVIRCFGCISEWSMRVSAAGRTKEWREKMTTGRARAAAEPSWMDPMMSPMSSIELPPEMADVVLPDDSEIDYKEWIELWRRLQR
ncbi:hypothetical protein UFOVP1279_28 [uncultured Caudovirales phage]|uniref:Uncharacterized protein n=1 Tax=uncultured Caudovirales phage TaxID=2100421 RepID=A0A6J5RLD5_9CAUD|nr:hypothetical protein UFOVP1279_28 [uncultured Caudovirales phage]